MKKILILNLGSTSFKCKLYDFDTGIQPLFTGWVENIGSRQSAFRTEVVGHQSQNGTICCPTHSDAFDSYLGFMSEAGCLAGIEELDAVGYKAVHGGSISGARKVDEELLSVMEEYVPFAPAHNPIYIGMMRRLRESYSAITQVACFETAFHSDIPEFRRVYGVPYEWAEKYNIRRYGFHGSSHQYIAEKMAQLSPQSKRIISLHLGGSSSVCAIKEGKSIATSMGATPQSGLFQNNRVGDLDCFCLPILAKHYGGDLEAVMKELSSHSGLLGVSGVSNDIRDIIDAAENKDVRAQLAIDAFVDGIVGYIGMFTAYLGGLDALVFTGGIGYKSAYIRGRVCRQLGFARVELDETKNQSPVPYQPISTSGSHVLVYALVTDEELIVAKKTMECLYGSSKKIL